MNPSDGARRGVRERLVGWITWAAALLIYGSFLAVLPLVTWAGRFLRTREREEQTTPRRLLLIGTFYTRNWAISHLRPLALAENVDRVTAVVDGPTADLPGVRYVTPPAWAKGGFSRAVCKLVLAVREGWRETPDLVMGYHLLPCAMSALLVGRLLRIPAGYQLTAGPIELLGGGSATENFFLRRLGRPSRLLEGLAFAIARQFDLLVVRGSKARAYLASRGVGTRVRLVPGSLDLTRFEEPGSERDIDIISVCRLVSIKQPDHIIRALAQLARFQSPFRAVILGDGPLREHIRRLAHDAGVADHLEIVGHVDEVDQYLRRAKIFLLTSRSEGLSIAMAEGMAAGAVPVVANVGELSDLVRQGVTGFCVPPGDFEEYANRMHGILTDKEAWARLSVEARRAAQEHNGLPAVAQRWSRTLEEIWQESSLREKVPSMAGSGLRRKVWASTPDWARRAVAPVLCRIRPDRLLGRGYRQWREYLERIEHEPAERHRAFQLSQLRRILAAAQEHSPYYRSLCRRAGFFSGDLRRPEDLACLPLLDAETVRTRGEEMRLGGRLGGHADFISTGGTGGKPLHFYIDRDRSAFEYAHLVTSWERIGFRPDMPLAVFRGEVVRRRPDGLRHAYDPILRRHSYSTFYLSDAMIRRYMDHIATIGDCFLEGYPSAISAICRCIGRLGLPVPGNIKGVLVGSENLFPEQRHLIEEVIQRPLLSWYGQSEKVVLAAECEHNGDYHVWPTYGYFELVDDEGRSVSTPGGRGEIVGTSFVNTVMPFIRYRTGDFATYVGDRCRRCGRHGPVIRDVRGHRTQELLVAKDGGLISWTALNMHDRTFQDVRQFQFEQRTPGEATLRIVPAEDFNDGSRRRIEQAMHRKLNGQLQVRLELTEQVRLSPRGKATYVDQHLDIPEAVRNGMT